MTFRARSQLTHGRSHLPKEHQSSEDSLNVVIITMVPAAAVIAIGSVASTSFLNKKVILFLRPQIKSSVKCSHYISRATDTLVTL